MAEILKDAAKAIASSKVVIGFTCAGISVESGIPDFRTMEHFWEGFDPATFEKEIDNKDAFEKNPDKVWEFFSQAIRMMEQVKPNNGHKALARLGELGCLAAVITQNVDNLHQEAGSEDVIEFHGNMRRLHCLKCDARYSWNEVRGAEIPPHCKCGSVLKPEVTLFGDEVPLEAFSASQLLAMNAQVFILVGTHGAIAPVNQIPVIAKDSGAVIVEVNKESSRYTDRITDYFLQGMAGEVLPSLVREVEAFLLTSF